MEAIRNAMATDIWQWQEWRREKRGTEIINALEIVQTSGRTLWTLGRSKLFATGGISGAAQGIRHLTETDICIQERIW
jgi:hypothetical protein